jgi:rhodanese-related sulfurtransferase
MNQTYETLTFEQAHEMLTHDPESILFDVREEEEYITGHADGALLFPVDSICAETAQELIPTQATPVMVYCRSGKRSQMAARRLACLGYTRVYDLGSLVGWPYGMAW